jgi:peptidyl-prolyl cis-trans isomerase B (cyclophilin B)
MARSANPDSAGSQFFICLADASFLNRQYTAFGEVIEGMDVVDKIAHTPTMGDPRNESFDRTASRPKEKVILKKVSIQEKK